MEYECLIGLNKSHDLHDDEIVTWKYQLELWVYNLRLFDLKSFCIQHAAKEGEEKAKKADGASQISSPQECRNG